MPILDCPSRTLLPMNVYEADDIVQLEGRGIPHRVKARALAVEAVHVWLHSRGNVHDQADHSRGDHEGGVAREGNRGEQLESRGPVLPLCPYAPGHEPQSGRNDSKLEAHERELHVNGLGYWQKAFQDRFEVQVGYAHKGDVSVRWDPLDLRAEVNPCKVGEVFLERPLNLAG